MVLISIPVAHPLGRHGRSTRSEDAVARAEAVALALGTQTLRILLPGLRPVVSPLRVVLSWRLWRLALRQEAVRRERERRRRLVAAAAVGAFGATLAGARLAASLSASRRNDAPASPRSRRRRDEAAAAKGS